MKKRTVLLVILASTCLISSLAFLLILKHKATLEDQYYMAYVSSGSMEPALKVSDYVVVDKNVNPAQLIAGFEYATIPDDIIAFYKPRHFGDPENIIAHRAVSKNQFVNGTWYFRTKGDANFGVDPWILPQGYIVGQVVDINPPLTLLDWNLLLWLTSVVAFGTGAFGSVIILLTRREKESDSSSTPT